MTPRPRPKVFCPPFGVERVTLAHICKPGVGQVSPDGSPFIQVELKKLTIRKPSLTARCDQCGWLVLVDWP